MKNLLSQENLEFRNILDLVSKITLILKEEVSFYSDDMIGWNSESYDIIIQMDTNEIRYVIKPPHYGCDTVTYYALAGVAHQYNYEINEYFQD